MTLDTAALDSGVQNTTTEAVGLAHVLVVEDSPPTAKLLERLLTTEGYAVIQARTGEAALEIILAERPDLVLLDLILPGIDGYAVCRLLRASPGSAMVPIVMVTGAESSD